MLGQKEHTAPLNSEESRKIRATAYRIATGILNEDDRKMIAHFDKLSAENTTRFIFL